MASGAFIFRERTSHLGNQVVFVRIHKHFLPTGAATVDVDGRIDAFVHESAIQHDFQIARALEFLKNYFVHTAARIDQSRGHNGE